jgi:hypothetical protein
MERWKAKNEGWPRRNGETEKRRNGESILGEIGRGAREGFDLAVERELPYTVRNFVALWRGLGTPELPEILPFRMSPFVHRRCNFDPQNVTPASVGSARGSEMRGVRVN